MTPEIIETTAEVPVDAPPPAEETTTPPPMKVTTEEYYQLRAIGLEIGQCDLQTQLLQSQAREIAARRGVFIQAMDTFRQTMFTKYNFDLALYAIKESGEVVPREEIQKPS